LLFSGNDLDRVPRVQLNGVGITPAYADKNKLMLVVPIGTPDGPLEIALRQGAGWVRQGLALSVVPRLNDYPLFPKTPLVPQPYVGIPPVSDEWRSECKFAGVEATRYFFQVDKNEGDRLDFSGTVHYSETTEWPVSANYSRATGLIEMVIEPNTYVGLVSTTEQRSMLRMILFPVTSGRQLVLLGCSQTIADEDGRLCPEPGAESIDLSDTPKDCIK